MLLPQRLTPAYASAYRTLMLAAYQHHPDAFSSSTAERARLPLAWWEQRLHTELDADPPASTQVWGIGTEAVLHAALGLRLDTGERLRHRAELFGMVVSPEWRRQGWGRWLLAAALAAARQQGRQAVRLTVSSHNLAAQRLYQQLGFVSFGEEPMAVACDSGFVSKTHMLCRTDGLRWSLVDSELLHMAADGQHLHFASAQVEQQPPDGGRRTAGHFHPLVLHSLNPVGVQALAAGGYGRVRDAWVLWQGQRLRHLPLPVALPGPCTLELWTGHGDSLRLDCSGLVSAYLPHSRYTESMAC